MTARILTGGQRRSDLVIGAASWQVRRRKLRVVARASFRSQNTVSRSPTVVLDLSATIIITMNKIRNDYQNGEGNYSDS